MLSETNGHFLNVPKENTIGVTMLEFPGMSSENKNDRHQFIPHVLYLYSYFFAKWKECCFYLNSYLYKGRKGQGLSKWPDLESQTSIYSWKLRAVPAGQRVNLEFIFKPGTKFNLFININHFEFTRNRSNFWPVRG